MKPYVIILSASCFAFALPSVAQETNTLGFSWQSPDTKFKLFIGTNSGNYQSSHTFTNKLAWLSPDAFTYGTNYIAVVAQSVNSNGTFAVTSDYSEEVIVVRSKGPGIRLVLGALSSTNFLDWSPLTNFVIAVSGTQPAEFFLPSMEIIPPGPDEFETPPSP